MATRGFGTTMGIGTTDSVEVPYATHHTLVTMGIWHLRNGTGGGALGRVYEKRVAGAQVNQFFNNSADSHLRWRQERATTPGEWDITAVPTTGAWEHYLIVYDGTSTANDPVIYKNGFPTAFTETSTPNGTITTNTDNWVVGNRKNDNARNHDGKLAEFAIWDRLLMPWEAAEIGYNRKSPLWFPTSLKLYAPGDMTTALVFEQGAGRHTTLVGTKLAEDLGIVYPPWLSEAAA